MMQGSKRSSLLIQFGTIIMLVLSSIRRHKCHALQSSLMRFATQQQNYLGARSRTYPFLVSPPSPYLSITSLFSTTSSESGFYANGDNFPTFASMGVQSEALLNRLETICKLTRPSAVQAAAYAPLLSGKDAVVGAETGSGKTLAYLIPFIDDILQKKQQSDDEFVMDYDYCRAVILVPNKELANQVLRMAVDLCGEEDGPRSCVVWDGSNRPPVEDQNGEEIIRGTNSDTVRLAILPGGLDSPEDFKPFRDSIGIGGTNAPIDLLICTPAALGAFGASPKNIDLFADIQTLIIDEADMLLDGGYLRQLEDVLMGFRRADKLSRSQSHHQSGPTEEDFFAAGKTQHVFIGATLPDFGLKSVDAYISKKFPYAERVSMPGLHNARHYGLKDGTIWLEQNSENNNKERMEQLVEFLRNSDEDGGLNDDKIMVFLNTVDDVDGVTNGLRRAGFKAVPYHAKIPLGERAANLQEFREYTAGESSDVSEMPILVCTDLASRGLDVPGVTAVVQLQFAGNVVAHLHRMGRCGRAGNKNGKGIIFYGPMEKDLVEVVQEAETQQEKMKLKGDVLDEEDKKGTVKNAFSRKRGFTKKRKKERRNM